MLKDFLRNRIDQSVYKKGIIYVYIWIVVNFGTLLLYSERIFPFSMNSTGRRGRSTTIDNADFWPFDYFSDIEDYDIREFLFYSLSVYMLLVLVSRIVFIIKDRKKG